MMLCHYIILLFTCLRNLLTRLNNLLTPDSSRYVLRHGLRVGEALEHRIHETGIPEVPQAHNTVMRRDTGVRFRPRVDAALNI